MNNLAEDGTTQKTHVSATYRFGSRAALMWLSGRDAEEGKARIVGFEDFARSLMNLYRASAKDNPYADARLLKIEHTLKELESFLERRSVVYDSQLDPGSDAISRPPLYFASESYTPPPLSPLAQRILTIMVDADAVVLLLNTLVHYGVKTKRQYHVEERGVSRRIRNLLGSAGHWKFFPISREDIRQRSEVAEEAIAFFKGLPSQEVMDKSIVPEYSRPIDRPTSGLDLLQPDLSDLIKIGR